MKKKLISFVGLLSIHFTTQAIEVQSLSQGSCWISNQADHVQAASFNEGKSYSIYRSNLEDLVGLLHENDISPKDIESIDPYYHCSGMGGRVVFRVKAAGSQYCTWAQFENNKLNFKPLDLADGDSGICDGVVANKIIVAPSEDGGMDKIVKDIEALGVEVTSVETIFRDLHSITFTKSEVEVFKIRNHLMENKSARIVDLVTRQHPIGDSTYLNSLSFKKE